MKSYVMCTPRHIFFGQLYQRGWNGRSMWHAWERFLLYRALFRNPEGKRPRGTTGRVELQGGSENEMLSTGFIWLRTMLLCASIEGPIQVRVAGPKHFRQHPSMQKGHAKLHTFKYCWQKKFVTISFLKRSAYAFCVG